MEFRLSEIKNAIAEADGLPRVEWAMVDQWIATGYASDDSRNAARLEAVLQWLELLADRLGEDYWINSAPRSILLTSQARSAGDALLRFVERALDQIARLLDVSPEAPGAPKHILLRLHSVEVYYSYINHFHEDGAYGGSAGICIRQGMPHIAFPRSPYGGEEETVAHELTHAVLSEFSAPLWVEEGVAQIVGLQVTGRPATPLNHETARDLRAYWRSHDLAGFWSGESFRAADDGQRHSYELAEILVRLILSDYKRAFLRFLADANGEDGGEAAAVKHFYRPLNEIAATFLGS